MDLDIGADKEVDKVASMVAGHWCWLIGPKLFWPKAYPTCVSSNLCEFILHQAASVGWISSQFSGRIESESLHWNICQDCLQTPQKNMDKWNKCNKIKINTIQEKNIWTGWESPDEKGESLDSRDFFWNFTSRSRSRVIFISLSLLDLDFQSFSFHFHFSKRVKGTKISPFFSRKKSEILHQVSWKI